MGDILFKIFISGFSTIFKFWIVLAVAAISSIHLPKTKNKFFRILKGVGCALILSALISFPRPSSDEDYHDDSPPKTREQQMDDFYKNFGSCLVIIFMGSRIFVDMIGLHRRWKNEEDTKTNKEDGT